MTTGEHPVTLDDRSSELTASFSETAQALFSAGKPADTLRAVVDLAVATIDGCDFASIFVLEDNTATIAVGTDSVAAGADLVQHQAGEGPGLDVIAHGGTVYAEDLAGDPRWVSFGPEAVKAGVRSALALRLSDDASRGVALILYARYPQAFGALDRAKGVILSAMGGLALSAAEAHEKDARDTIQAALAAREMIGQAEGILMEREHITADQAYEILRRAAHDLDTRVRDVAQVLVDTGKRP